MLNFNTEPVDKKSNSNSSFNIISSVATSFLRNTFITEQPLIPIIKDGEVEIQSADREQQQEQIQQHASAPLSKESATSTMTRVAAAGISDEESNSTDRAIANQKQLTNITNHPDPSQNNDVDMGMLKNASIGKQKSIANEQNIVPVQNDLNNENLADSAKTTNTEIKSDSATNAQNNANGKLSKKDYDAGSSSGSSAEFPTSTTTNTNANTVNKTNNSTSNQHLSVNMANCTGTNTFNTNRSSVNSSNGNSASSNNSGDTPQLVGETKNNKNEKKARNKKFYVRISPYMDLTTNGFLYFGPMIRKVEAGNCIKIGRFTEKFKDAFDASSKSSAPIVFKSKVVSRSHALLGVNKNGEWFIKDVKSSAGTFLNRRRLSPANEESGKVEVKNGDVIQLGVDFRGGTEEIYRCVKMKIELNKSWVMKNKNFTEDARQKLQTLSGNESEIQCCVICLEDIKQNQAIFFSPCSHIYHYKCIRRIVYKTYPQFTCPTCRSTSDLEADEDDDLATSSEEEEEDETEASNENDVAIDDQQQSQEDAVSIYEMDQVEDNNNIATVRAGTHDNNVRTNEERIVIDVDGEDEDNDQIMT